MFYLVASAATLISYHTLSYLVNNFFNFFRSCLLLCDWLSVCYQPFSQPARLYYHLEVYLSTLFSTFLFYPAHYTIHWLTTHFFTYPSFLYLKGLRHRLWLVSPFSIYRNVYIHQFFFIFDLHISACMLFQNFSSALISCQLQKFWNQGFMEHTGISWNSITAKW